MARRQFMVFIFLLLLGGAGFLTARAAAPARRWVISEQGALGDGRTVNTRAIQGAIDRCAAGGGGTLVVPKGVFVSGALFFKQGVSLLVEKDGVLKSTAVQSDFPQVKTRWEGVERLWTCAFLNFTDMDGVELSGAGTIDGSSDLWLGAGRGARAGAAPTSATLGRGARRGTTATARGAGGRRGNTPTSGSFAARPAVDLTLPGIGRPRLICFQNCKNVRIANLNMRRQAVWCLHLLYSENVVVEGLTIRAIDATPSSDGIDVDSCRRVRIAKCDMDVNDDCISIKAGKDADGLRVNRPSEDILIENCRFGYGHGGAAMGSETTGGIRNVEIRDCVADAGNWAPIRFKSQPSRGGVVENITYRNLQIKDCRQAFEFNMEWRMVPPIAPPAKVLPVVRNVRCINITGTAASAGLIHGLPGSPIQGVTFEGCKVTAQRGLVIENARDINVAGLDIKASQGQPVTIRETTPR